MPQGAEGTPVKYSDRGYQYTHDKNNIVSGNGDQATKDWDTYFQRFAFSKPLTDSTTTDNCAMLCDEVPFCKSFTIFNDSRSQNAQCMLSKKKSAGNSKNYTSDDFKNTKSYDKPDNTPSSLPTTRITGRIRSTPTSDNADYSAWQSCRGDRCCYNNYSPWKPNVTSRGYQFNWEGGEDACASWGGAAASACLPGVVTYANTPNEGNSIDCGYNRLDTTWTQQNWENLAGFGFDTNNIQSIKLTHCNGLTYDELSRDTNQCTSVSGFNKNARLLDMISNTWWTDPNEVSKLQTMATNSKTDSSLIDGVKTKLNKLPITGTWSPNVIKFIRSLVADGTVYAIDATSLSVAYCNNNQGSAECACIKETLTWSADKCAGQNCTVTGNTFGKAISETTNTLIKAKLQAAYVPLCHTDACQVDTKLLPGGKPTNCPADVLNICYDQAVVGGSVAKSTFQQLCNFDTSVGTTESSVTTSTGATGATGDTGATGSSGTENSNTTYIVIAILLCCCCLLALGGLGLFMFNA